MGHGIDQRFPGLTAGGYPAFLAAFPKDDPLTGREIDLGDFQVSREIILDSCIRLLIMVRLRVYLVVDWP